MRTLMLITGLIFYSLLLQAQNNNKMSDKRYEQMIKKHTIENAQIGDLISLDEYGNYILATGSMFEKILGFTTSAPYVTPNKPTSPNGNRVEFIGIVSIENGVIKEGDYLCPSNTIPGKVMKCTNKDTPYAVAMESANSDFTKIKVKILGYRRVN